MSQAQGRIRAVTWNVHGCVGSTRSFDPDGVIALLRGLSPDVVALQEVDSRERLADGLDTFEYLAQELAWRSAQARTICTPQGDYGHIVLSPWPIEDVRVLDLSVTGREPRAAIVCRIPRLGVEVIAAHLGRSARERRRQIEGIFEHVSLEHDPPMIVLGDFNEWSRMGVATRMLCPPFRQAASLPSFPARRPLFGLDRIWCEPPLEPLAAFTVKAAARWSDHLAAVADLGLPEPSAS